MRRMKDSGIEWIGEIPAEWDIVRIGSQYTERKTKVSDTEFPPLSVTMKGVVPQLATAAKTDAHDDRRLVCKGDFAINSRSDRRGSCGISAYDGSVSLINTILCPRDEMNPEYYDWLFHSTMFSDEFYKWGHGIVDDLWTTNWQDMKKISIPEPTLEEQAKIAKHLTKMCAEIDAVIAKTKATIEEYKKLKQSIITEVVSGKVKIENGKICGKYDTYKDSGIEWIGEIPSEWIVSRFKYVATVKSNLVAPDEYMIYPQISPENIEKGSGKLLPCKTVAEVGVISGNHLFYEGQILYSKIRPKLNKVVIAPFDGLCSADMYPIETSLHKKFFLYSLLSDVLLQQVSLITEDRVKMPKINQEELGNTWFVLPPLSEQQQIADYLDQKCSEIDSVITKKEQLVVELEAYKKSLIYEVVTGKREV